MIRRFHGLEAAITRLGISAEELQEAVAGAADAKAVRRMLGIALGPEGWSREDAAAACANDRQTLRGWVHRYNAMGLAGLSDRPRRNGPRPRLSEDQQAAVARWVERGPDLERDGVVRWRGFDLQRRIEAEFGIALHESTIGKMLRRLRFIRLQPRPCHPQKDAAEQEAFKDHTFVARVAEIAAATAGKRLEIWFSDETRVGQQGTLTYVWTRRGSRPSTVRDNRHDSAYLFGAICAEHCVGAAIIMADVNSESTTEHLKEISCRVTPGAHAILLLDGAGWHQAGERLPVPDDISLLPPPPYAPELNPMENVWEFLRGKFLSHRVWNSYQAILQACRSAWNRLLPMADQIATLTRRPWAKPVIG